MVLPAIEENDTNSLIHKRLVILPKVKSLDGLKLPSQRLNPNSLDANKRN